MSCKLDYLPAKNPNLATSNSIKDFFASTLNSTQDLDLFLHCWRRQTCESCLGTPRPCSWCAISQTCVPNEHRFAILAPIKNEHVCPLGWRERWEMRAKPFSCRCSSMTFVSVVVAVLSALLGVLLLWLLQLLTRYLWRRWKKREEGWWRARNWRLGKGLTSRCIGRRKTQNESERSGVQRGEQEPLLA